MNSVSMWILSVAGIVVISVLLELVLPEGQINKYVKSIFSFIVLLVIILPLPKLFNKDFSIDNIFQSQEVSLQEDYLHELNISKLSAIKLSLDDEFEDMGYGNIEISISASVLQEELEIYTIFVDLSDLVICENAEHKDIIDIKKDITKVITENELVIEKEVVFGKDE